MRFLRAPMLAVFAALSASSILAAAQGFTLRAPTYLQGLMRVQGVTPTATGCTVATGAVDSAGSCTTTATSGAIVFAVTNLGSAPFCIVLDSSASPAQPVYTVTPTQITLTTVTAAHVLRWHCDAQGSD